MQITITTIDGNLITLDIDPNSPVEDLKALVEVETGIPLPQQELLKDGVELTNNAQKISETGLKETELLLVRRKQQAGGPQAAQQGAPAGQAQGQGQGQQMDAATLRDYIRNNPQILQQLLHSNPTMAEAVLSEDLTLLENILRQQEAAKRQQENERLRYINQLNADPFDMEAQRKIEEEIRMENVNENYEHAMEHIPEVFGRVHMLYIDCQVNGVHVKAFVDTGAQSTIMSVQCAERCGIMRLIDRRFAGIAKGVGTAKIHGRVHVAPIKIGSSFYPSSFTILEGQDLDFLLGLDVLKHHQCTVDLKENVLRVGSEVVPFLAEKDIPLHLSAEDINEGNFGLPRPPSPTIPKQSSSSTAKQPLMPTPSKPPAPTASPASAPTSTQPQKPQAKPSVAQASPYSEEVIRNLMGLGQSREAVLRALEMFGGNAEMAASYLFTGGMDF